ncbi:MAG: 4Fe-4S cluster-binding domain-containing protein [Firmicutes bacterium]|nr:4Fe-4S cluster-binding domain-containing protein [Bacillota bacterium]
MTPSYLELHKQGLLEKRAQEAIKRLGSCNLCPWLCKIDRTGADANGTCRTGRYAKIASYNSHFGEESSLVGWGGSGTIFFSSCNMHCVFCQNYEISQLREGHTVNAEQLAEIMLKLQEVGCHNINFVSPSHVVAQILEALVIAAERGLTIPLVYNTGGYDSIPTLRLLDGVIDIYMPDIKYMDAATALLLSGVKGYPQVVKAAITEMHRQVGDLVIDDNGVAVRGLLVRHLVLPENLAGTADAMEFLAKKISRQTCVNVMDQYYPSHKASKYPPMDRRITQDEFENAVSDAKKAGLRIL